MSLPMFPPPCRQRLSHAAECCFEVALIRVRVLQAFDTVTRCQDARHPIYQSTQELSPETGLSRLKGKAVSHKVHRSSVIQGITKGVLEQYQRSSLPKRRLRHLQEVGYVAGEGCEGDQRIRPEGSRRKQRGCFTQGLHDLLQLLRHQKTLDHAGVRFRFLASMVSPGGRRQLQGRSHIKLHIYSCLTAVISHFKSYFCQDNCTYRLRVTGASA